MYTADREDALDWALDHLDSFMVGRNLDLLGLAEELQLVFNVSRSEARLIARSIAERFDGSRLARNRGRRRKAEVTSASLSYVVEVSSVKLPSLSLEMEELAENEGAYFNSCEDSEDGESCEFRFDELDEAGRFLRGLKDLGVMIND